MNTKTPRHWHTQMPTGLASKQASKQGFSLGAANVSSALWPVAHKKFQGCGSAEKHSLPREDGSLDFYVWVNSF